MDQPILMKGIGLAKSRFVERGGLEPPTTRLFRPVLYQLSYRSKFWVLDGTRTHKELLRYIHSVVRLPIPPPTPYMHTLPALICAGTSQPPFHLRRIFWMPPQSNFGRSCFNGIYGLVPIEQ